MRAQTCLHGRKPVRSCRTCKKLAKQRWYSRQSPEQRRAYHERHRNPEKIAAKNQFYWLRRNQFIQWLKAVPCMDCGQRYPPYCMDFDHRDGVTKVFGISKVSSLGRLQAEVMKCDVVCAICLRVRTARRMRRGARK